MLHPVTTIAGYNTADARASTTTTSNTTAPTDSATWTVNGFHQRRQTLRDRSPKLEMELQDDDSGYCKKKIRDPLSHRIIEKRRRDRMNSCLADLSKLIPVAHLRTGHGRIEKTEIIEMAIKHLKQLQANVNIAQMNERCNLPYADQGSSYLHQFQNGYQECTSEIMRFLVEVEGYYAGDRLCVRLLSHLQQHCNKLLQGLHTNTVKQESSPTIEKSNPTICDTAEEKPYNLKSCLTFCTNPEREVKPLLRVLECGNPSDTTFKSLEPQVMSVSPSGNESKPEHPRQSAQSPSDACKIMAPQDSVSKSRPVSVASSSSSTRSDETYKYKNNIKDRFNADLQQHSSTSESESGCDAVGSKRGSPIVTQDAHTNGCPQLRQDFSNLPELIDLKSYFSPSLTDHSGYRNFMRNDFMQNLLPDALSIGRLPMFVLHPNRNFYIPMTIASSIIDSVVNKVNSYLPLLHSVNILVYFGNTVNLPESTFRLM